MYSYTVAMNYPKNMIEFIDQFHTEEQCLLYLEQRRWNWICPKCWTEKYWRHWKRRVRICSTCRSVLCVTAWTVLDRLRIPLRTVFLIWWFLVTSKQWISSDEISNMLWISIKTAWLRSQKLRKIMILDERKKLSWDIEIDEVFIWWVQPWKRWRWANWKSKVVIAVEKNTKNKNKEWLYRWMWRIRVKVIPNCSEKTLTNFIENNLEKESVIYTDWWLWYKNIWEKWYSHIIEKKIVSNDENIWVNSDEVTPNVHIIASLIKRWLLWTHQQFLEKDWYLQDYLEEYTFRFNKRKSDNRWFLFETLIKQILTHQPTTLKKIQLH